MLIEINWFILLNLPCQKIQKGKKLCYFTFESILVNYLMSKWCKSTLIYFLCWNCLLLLIYSWIRQATLTAEDILNSWPELEIGRILRDYGEESNWQSLQRRIVKERKTGGLHSTGELVKLIQRTCTISGGMCEPIIVKILCKVLFYFCFAR